MRRFRKRADRLQEGRRRIKASIKQGRWTIQVCTALTELLDEVVLAIFEAAFADLAPSADAPLRTRIALVAQGGYGRQNVCLLGRGAYCFCTTWASEIAPLAKRLLQDLFDAGLTLGQSVRTPGGACALRSRMRPSSRRWSSRDSWRGIRPCSIGSCAVSQDGEAALAGNDRGHRQGARRRAAQFGETVYLLEPNVKLQADWREPAIAALGGFCAAWRGRRGRADADGGVERRSPRGSPARASFCCGCETRCTFTRASGDSLERAEQVRIADIFGFRGTPSILPVERFMSEYFRHTSTVRHIVARAIDASRPWSRVADFVGPFSAVAWKRTFGSDRGGSGPRKRELKRSGKTWRKSFASRTWRT